MSDPFKLLMPNKGSQTGEVRQHVENQSLTAWRQAGIALPDLYIIERDSAPPAVVGEDGLPMTPERFAEMMKGVKPMFEPSPDGDNTKAKPTGQRYVDTFDDRIEQEVLGKTAVDARPKGLRIFKPRQVDSLDGTGH